LDGQPPSRKEITLKKLGIAKAVTNCINEGLRLDPANDTTIINAWRIHFPFGRSKPRYKAWKGFYEGSINDDHRMKLLTPNYPWKG